MANTRRLPVIVAVNVNKKIATVRVNGRDEEMTCVFSDSVPGRMYVSGFAAQFPTGGKLWECLVIFEEKTSDVWRYSDMIVHDWTPRSGQTPPYIVGLIRNVAADEQGIGGVGRDGKILMRNWRGRLKL